MLEINEIFGPTIQGEGKRCGTPSVFIRFGKCNLKCEGFAVEYTTPSGIKKCSCDSYYAVDTEFRNEWLKFYSANDLIHKVSTFIPDEYKPDIVITGGEPLLYWNDVEFQKLLEYYISNDFNVTIETNATIFINIEHEYQRKILFSMSVKLSNSLEPLKKRINLKSLINIIDNIEHSYLKFVIGADFIEIAKNEIEELLNKLPKVEVFLMPLGDSNELIAQNSPKIIELALKKGFNYSDRLHIRVWDNKRGV